MTKCNYSDDDIEHLIMRLHNTEVALVSMWSLVKDSIAIDPGNDVDQMIEEYFYHQERLGAFDQDQFFMSDDPIDDIKYSIEFKPDKDVQVLDKTTGLSIKEALELKDKLINILGLHEVQIKVM